MFRSFGTLLFILVLTAYDGIRADLQCLSAAIFPRKLCAKDHTTACRFLFVFLGQMLWKTMLNVHVAFLQYMFVKFKWLNKLNMFAHLQYTNAIASYSHVCLRFKVNFNDHGSVYFFLIALRWVLAGNFARLVKHVWCYATNVSANKHLKNCSLVVAGQPDNGKPVATSILDGTTATFSLIPGTMLLLWLRNNLQLDVSVIRTGYAVQWRCWLPFICYACDCTSPNKSDKRKYGTFVRTWNQSVERKKSKKRRNV